MGPASPGICPHPRPQAAPPLIVRPRREAHTTSRCALLGALVSSHPPVYFQNIPFSPAVTAHSPARPLNTRSPPCGRATSVESHAAWPGRHALRSGDAVASVSPFRGRLTFPCADRPRSVRPAPGDGHLLAVIRNATVKTHVQVFVQTGFRRPWVGISQEWNGLVAVATLFN